MLRISLAGSSESAKNEALDVINKILKKAGAVPTILPGTLMVEGLTQLNFQQEDSSQYHLYNLFFRRMWEFQAVQQEQPILSLDCGLTDIAYQKAYLDRLVTQPPSLLLPGPPGMPSQADVVKQATMVDLQSMIHQAIWEIVYYWQFIYFLPSPTGSNASDNIKQFVAGFPLGIDKIRTVPLDTNLEEYFTEQFEDWKANEIAEQQQMGLAMATDTANSSEL